MLVSVTSDLHLNFADANLPGGDVLVLAGDVFEAGYIRRAETEGRNVSILDRYRRFMDTELQKYNTVLYVFGNHEYYSHDYHTARTRIEKYLPPNVIILENNYVKLDDTLFWGATMWTDNDGGNPVVRQACNEEMTDYRVIKHDPAIFKQGAGGGYWTGKFTAEDTETIHAHSRARLKEFLEAYSNHKTVVITHHAPSYESISAEYRGHVHGYINHAYYSDLTGLMLDNPQIKLWAHGHVHCMNDYQIGQCRVVTNPRGYVGYEHQADRWEATKKVLVEF
jgi:predicted phosphohydrolase